jgi:serine O-acetyltransferase
LLERGVLTLEGIDGEYESTLAFTKQLLRRQLSSLFVLGASEEGAVLDRCADDAMRRSMKCFSHVGNKYYHRDGKPFFDPFHSGQYAIFLYYLSNTISVLGPQRRSLADRVYYLNKALNGVDLYHEVELPKIFFLEHPLGSVMGRARYSDFFSFSQNCTVGNNKGVYPRLGKNVLMMSGSKVLGDCDIGSHVILAANCYVKDTSIPSRSIVFGSSPDLVVKQMPVEYFLEKTEAGLFLPEKHEQRGHDGA